MLCWIQMLFKVVQMIIMHQINLHFCPFKKQNLVQKLNVNEAMHRFDQKYVVYVIEFFYSQKNQLFSYLFQNNSL